MRPFSANWSRRGFCFLAVALLASAFAGAANAQQWPTRVVRFVVPFSAEGTTDILGRLMAQKLSEEHL